MTHRAPRSRLRGWLILAALPLLFCACTFPLGTPPAAPQSRAQQSLLDACRQRADEAYNLTHRGDIYASASQVNTPFSANYTPGVADRGLSDLYARDRMISDCVRNTGAEGSRTPTGTELPPGAPLPPSTPLPAQSATRP